MLEKVILIGGASLAIKGMLYFFSVMATTQVAVQQLVGG